jgi:hypothetical protein
VGPASGEEAKSSHPVPVKRKADARRSLAPRPNWIVARIALLLTPSLSRERETRKV